MSVWWPRPTPSIIEVRELSLSQVCLYLGGWISILGSFVLFYSEWESIPTLLQPLPAMLVTTAMIILGIRMWRKRESRLAVGFMATSNLLIPITILLMLGQWRILHPHDYPLGAETIAEKLEGSHLVFGNIQLLISASLWLGFSALFLRITRSSIFVLLSTIAFLALLTICYVIGGMLEMPNRWPDDVIAGRYLYPGLGLFGIGILADRRRLTHYAIPPCIIGLVLIVGSLSIIAYSDNTLFGWLWAKPNSILEAEEQTGLSFIFNGLFYLALASTCGRMGTVLQRRIAQVLNWMGPLHILGVLRALDSNHIDHRIIYRILLPIASIAFVFSSVARQMKSFFFSGLAGIAAAVHRFTVKHLDKFFSWPVSLMIIGIVAMLVSVLVPRLQASRKLRSKK